MPVFRYKARSTRGDSVAGTLEAANPDMVAAQLIEGGLTPISIEAFSSDADIAGGMAQLSAKFEKFFAKIEATDLIQFSRQMHSLLRAGVPILSAISGLATNAANPTMAVTLGKVMENLEAGRPLSDSLSPNPEVFSVFYISMIRVGETSGKLVEIFLQLAFYLEREKKTRDQIKAMLRYPMFVIGAIFAALAIISIWVIPAFAGLFASFNAQLPLPTRILMGFSDFVMTQWPWLLLGSITTVTAVRMHVKSAAGRYRWHKIKLRIPLVGKIIYKTSLGRFAHLFSMSLSAGVPLVTGLTVVARALNNVYLEERLMSMREGVENGQTLSSTAANSNMFDHLVLQMLKVGEESGTIAELLDEVADYYDREVDYGIDKLAASIEPILTLVIGGLVLCLAVGVFLPMWDLASAALEHRR